MRKSADLDEHGLPKDRLFGPTYGLDHRLFDGDHLKPDVRHYVLKSIDGFWGPRYGADWPSWARVYFAGSEASEWTSPVLEGNNDFDILIGVDYDRFRAAHPEYADEANLEITERFNKEFKHESFNGDALIMIDGVVTGPWDRTTYVNPDSYDIRDIRPYAAYDVSRDEWAVRPPHLPDWDLSKFPQGEGLTQEVKGVMEMARGILAMPEPYRTQQASQLWDYIHSTRNRAFGPQGEGWWDSNNVLEKALDQAGLWHQLYLLMHDARENPALLNAPADWSNSPHSG